MEVFKTAFILIELYISFSLSHKFLGPQASYCGGSTLAVQDLIAGMHQCYRELVTVTDHRTEH